MEAVSGYSCLNKIPVRGAGRRDPPPPLPFPGSNFRAFVSLKILGSPLSAGSQSCITPLRSSSSPILSPTSLSVSSKDAKEFVPGSSSTPETSEPTVRARFVLNRECSYGEQFFLVGEDPALGSWEPSVAIPMIWTEGHNWCTEQDIPIGTKVRFKFILKNASGEVEWQPGPDRALKLWETDKTIMVEENWEAAELQKVTEELPEEPVMESAMPMVVASVEEEVKKDELSEIHNSVTDDFIENDEGPVLIPGLSSMSIIGSGERPEVKQDETADEYEMGTENAEGPVLVPGLSSMSIIGAGEQASEEKQAETADEYEMGTTIGEHSTAFYSDEDEGEEEEFDIDSPRTPL